MKIMSAVLELPRIDEKAIALAIETRKHAVFYDVGWEAYEEILDAYPERRNPKLFYDRGVLEIMPKSSEHEIPIFSLFSLIEQFAEQLKLDSLCIGQATLNREDLLRGFEPDCSFYFQEKAEQMRGKDRIDLLFDAPPDLIVEIDITHSSLDKFALFAAVGIAEIWIFEEKRLKILRLEQKQYVEREMSLVFPNVSSEILTRFIEDSQKMKSYEWRASVQIWIKKNLQR